MTLRFQMSSIMGVIRPEQLESFAPEFESILEKFLVQSITLSCPVGLNWNLAFVFVSIIQSAV